MIAGIEANKAIIGKYMTTNNEPKTLSVVIPIYNMGDFLPSQLESYSNCGMFHLISEIVFVNDGSTDHSKDILAQLKKQYQESHQHIKIEILNLEENVGRFKARLIGARKASSNHLLFLDCRLSLPNTFGKVLKKLFAEYSCIMGHVDIDIKRNIFCLYWDRSHKFIFKNHFSKTQKRVLIDQHNYDEFLKGTTVFLTPKEIFINVSQYYEKSDLLSDDTYLLKKICKEVPICLDPELRISWVPRETLSSFLERLWERGPSFSEYHIFTHRGLFFYLMSLGIIFSLTLLVFLFIYPMAVISIIAATFLLVAGSTALFSKSPTEFIKMVPLHFSVVITFFVGACNGILVNLKRQFKQSIENNEEKKIKA